MRNFMKLLMILLIYLMGKEMLDIVAKKGADAFDLFVSALKEEEKHLDHEFLAKRLEKRKGFSTAYSPASWA